MPLDVLGPLWAAMTLDIRAARIDCPAGLSDLAANKVFVRGLAGANSDVGLTLGEIEIVITRQGVGRADLAGGRREVGLRNCRVVNDRV